MLASVSDGLPLWETSRPISSNVHSSEPSCRETVSLPATGDLSTESDVEGTCATGRARRATTKRSARLASKSWRADGGKANQEALTVLQDSCPELHANRARKRSVSPFGPD